MVFKGRLGLETARVPHADRHGLIWLERGKLGVEAGNLVFTTAGTHELERGLYEIPYQTITNVMIGPGTTVTHDALRLLARHGTGLIAVGSNGVRFYASMPLGPDRSQLARDQVELWSDRSSRIQIARRMYGIRFGELLPQRDLNALRGIEGRRMKQVYQNLAEQFGVSWKGRRYDKSDPESDDIINKAINHASSAVRAAAMVAVAVTGTIPQLGFIHEHSGKAFALDIADLFRAEFMLPCAFEAAKKYSGPDADIERITRRLTGRKMKHEKLVPKMIDAIKTLLEAPDDDDGSGNT